MTRLSSRQLKSLLECIHNIHSCTDFDAFPTNTLSALSLVLPATVATYDEFDLQKQKLVHYEAPFGHLQPEDLPIVEKYLHEHPLISLLYPNRKQPHAMQKQIEKSAQKSSPGLRQAPAGRAVKISDLLTNKQFQRLALYNEFYKKYGIEYQMLMQVSGIGSVTTGITFNRGKKDFSEQERLLLNLLGPHVTQAYNNAKAVQTLKNKFTPQTLNTQKAKSKLTSRESEILFWVAQGKTNADVAGILNISRGTVRNHLEHIYNKLGVENRTAAAIIALKELKNVKT